MQKLKPCPFCGGKAKLYVNGGVCVICLECKAQTEMLTDILSTLKIMGNSTEAVVEKWNRRVNDLGVCRVAPQGYDIDLCPYQSSGCKKQCTYQGDQED